MPPMTECDRTLRWSGRATLSTTWTLRRCGGLRQGSCRTTTGPAWRWWPQDARCCGVRSGRPEGRPRSSSTGTRCRAVRRRRSRRWPASTRRGCRRGSGVAARRAACRSTGRPRRRRRRTSRAAPWRRSATVCIPGRTGRPSRRPLSAGQKSAEWKLEGWT